jgi:hypothetical protein
LRTARRLALAVKSRRTRSRRVREAIAQTGSRSAQELLRGSIGSPGSNSSASRLLSATSETVSRRGATAAASTPCIRAVSSGRRRSDSATIGVTGRETCSTLAIRRSSSAISSLSFAASNSGFR